MHGLEFTSGALHQLSKPNYSELGFFIASCCGFVGFLQTSTSTISVPSRPDLTLSRGIFSPIRHRPKSQKSAKEYVSHLNFHRLRADFSSGFILALALAVEGNGPIRSVRMLVVISSSRTRYKLITRLTRSWT
jgi:hypothetical protein